MRTYKPPEDPFDRVNARLRQAACTAVIYLFLLAYGAQVVAYVVALAKGHAPPPPSLPSLAWP